MEAGLAAAGAPDDQNIFIDVVLWILVPAKHDALSLRQQNILVKLWVNKGLDILGSAP